MGRSLELCSEYIEAAYLDSIHIENKLNCDGHTEACHSSNKYPDSTGLRSLVCVYKLKLSFTM